MILWRDGDGDGDGDSDGDGDGDGDDGDDGGDEADDVDDLVRAGGEVQCSQVAGGNITIMESNQPTVGLIVIFGICILCISLCICISK